MMALDLIVFVLLAVLCNTVFPIPFDPVLINFATRYSGTHAVVFAILASLRAGLSGICEAKALGLLNGRIPRKWSRMLLPQWYGRRFYIRTFLFALLPLPFTVVRLAVLRHQPKVFPYGLAIVLGRFPRYLVMMSLCRTLAFPCTASVGIRL